MELEEIHTFNKIINDFYIEVELTKDEPSELSFLLVQNRRQQCFQLKFGNQTMPPQLRALFQDIKELYQYLFYFQDNRNYFDIFPQGSLKIVKQTKANNYIDVRTLQLTTFPVKVKESTIEDGNFMQQHNYISENRLSSSEVFNQHEDHIDLGGSKKYSNTYGFSQNYIPQTVNKSMRNINQICQNALMMIKNGISQEKIAHNLKIKHSTVKKMFAQVRMYGTIYPPQKSHNSYSHNFQNSYESQIKQNNDNLINFQQNQEQYYHINQTQQETWSEGLPRQLGPVTPNMKMHGDGVRQIKKMLFVLVKQGKMQSLDQMRNFLLEKNIDRSLSSIYRYISSIKAEHPEFQGRNYTMYRKDLEMQLPLTKPAIKNSISKNSGQKSNNEN